jgi:hypothetical protein
MLCVRLPANELWLMPAGSRGKLNPNRKYNLFKHLY